MTWPRGAEAVLTSSTRSGQAVVTKARFAKGYRHPKLDARLRELRTRDEAALLMAARRAGVAVPVVYDIDRTACALVLETIEGPTLREHLVGLPDHDAKQVLGKLGAKVAALHAAGITHGDLTTSNVLVQGGHLVLIDFGLGQFTQEDEARGVDLHLIEEALESTDGRADALFEAFMDAYRAWAGAHRVEHRLEAIRERGRYR